LHAELSHLISYIKKDLERFYADFNYGTDGLAGYDNLFVKYLASINIFAKKRDIFEQKRKDGTYLYRDNEYSLDTNLSIDLSSLLDDSKYGGYASYKQQLQNALKKIALAYERIEQHKMAQKLMDKQKAETLKKQKNLSSNNNSAQNSPVAKNQSAQSCTVRFEEPVAASTDQQDKGVTTPTELKAKKKELFVRINTFMNENKSYCMREENRQELKAQCKKFFDELEDLNQDNPFQRYGFDYQRTENALTIFEKNINTQPAPTPLPSQAAASQIDQHEHIGAHSLGHTASAVLSSVVYTASEIWESLMFGPNNIAHD